MRARRRTAEPRLPSWFLLATLGGTFLLMAGVYAKVVSVLWGTVLLGVGLSILVTLSVYLFGSGKLQKRPRLRQ